MNRCQSCGEEVNDRATFCPSCGKPIKREQETFQSNLPNPPAGTNISNDDELRLDCNACRTRQSMEATKVPKFSGVVRTIGVILLIPSFLGMATGVLLFVTTIISQANMPPDHTGGANAAFGIIFVIALIVFVGSLVGGLLGWLLLLNRSVWKCLRCGYILDRG